MDINDILGKGPSLKRPVHPDMDRVLEIVLEMKAITQEHRASPSFALAWQRRIEQAIDFDVLAYQAMQVGFDLFGIQTGHDWVRLVNSPRYPTYIKAVQAFYDGFLLGTAFQQRGGKR